MFPALDTSRHPTRAPEQLNQHQRTGAIRTHTKGACLCVCISCPRVPAYTRVCLARVSQVCHARWWCQTTDHDQTTPSRNRSGLSLHVVVLVCVCMCVSVPCVSLSLRVFFDSACAADAHAHVTQQRAPQRTDSFPSLWCVDIFVCADSLFVDVRTRDVAISHASLFSCT